MGNPREGSRQQEEGWESWRALLTPLAASAFVLVKHHLKSSGFARKCSSGCRSCHLQREAQMSKHPPTFPLRLLDCNGSRVVPEHITPK